MCIRDSDIYGCHSGFGNAVVFIDNEFNGKLSPGDKFVIFPGASGSDLESISDLADYSFRLEYIGGSADNTIDPEGGNNSTDPNLPVGQMPTALAGDDAEGEVGVELPFTGLGADPDGTIVLYEWDFDGDGEVDWSSSTTGMTTHIYEKMGRYKASLTVTDNDGNKVSDSRLVDVAKAQEEAEPIDTDSDELSSLSLVATLGVISIVALRRKS